MGGGGDGGFAQNQAAQEAKKQAARDALNRVFGVAGSAPNRADFTTTTPGTTGGSYVMQGDNEVFIPGNPTPATETFDQAGYDAALAAYNSAGPNKAAREALYDKIRSDAFNAGRRAFDEDYADAARQNRFALFAQGLNGGSADIDENALLARTRDRGLLELGAKADAARAGVEGNDEQTRLGLLQSIDAGMDQGSALSSALSQMRVNSDRAAADAQGTDIGDLFADAGLLYTKSNLARGQQDAMDWWKNNYRQPKKSSTGIVTQR